MELTLSPLGHTWILDLDGTIVEHNGYRTYGRDRFLPGAEAFLHSLPESDMVIFLTSRTEGCRELTEKFLRESSVRYDHLILGAPYGERILVNDDKPSGLRTGIAVNTVRDKEVMLTVRVDERL